MIGICHNCGANLEPGATKCRRCGAEVTEEPVKEPVRKNKTLRARLSWPWLMEARRKWLFLAAAVIGLLLLALILTATILSFKNKGAQPEITPASSIKRASHLSMHLASMQFVTFHRPFL